MSENTDSIGPTCVYQAEIEDDHDDSVRFGPVCGKAATHTACTPIIGPVCEAHKCRCSKPLGAMTGELCPNCNTRQGTLAWAGTMDSVSIARRGCNLPKWCEWCAVSEQLRYAEERAAAIPGLRARLVELEQV